MNEITCPHCATVNRYVELVPHADNFCRECDFPLFWDQMLVPVLATTTPTTDAALRRLPGVAGRDIRQGRPCPDCGEHNLVAAKVCIRCGALMDPLPAPPPPPPPEPEPEVVAEYEPIEDDPYWALVIAVLLVLVLTGVVLIWVSLG